MEWFMLALRNTFNFKGRARRKEYGWFLVFNFLIAVVLVLLETASIELGLLDLATLFAFANGLIGLGLFITTISLTTRRLHDLGYSGWWQLLGNLLVITIIGYIIYILVLIFKDGQRFSNKYGTDPKATSSDWAQNVEKEEPEHKNKIVQKF